MVAQSEYDERDALFARKLYLFLATLSTLPMCTVHNWVVLLLLCQFGKHMCACVRKRQK